MCCERHLREYWQSLWRINVRSKPFLCTKRRTICLRMPFKSADSILMGAGLVTKQKLSLATLKPLRVQKISLALLSESPASTTKHMVVCFTKFRYKKIIQTLRGCRRVLDVTVATAKMRRQKRTPVYARTFTVLLSALISNSIEWNGETAYQTRYICMYHRYGNNWFSAD